MTDEDIDNLQAGRELDALIAEKVMGWIWRACPDTFRPGRPWCRWLTEPDRNLPKWDGVTEMRVDDLYDEESSVLQYSTDIAAAWLVVEKIIASDTDFELEHRSPEWRAGYRYWNGEWNQSAEGKRLCLVSAAFLLNALPHPYVPVLLNFFFS